MRPVECVNNHFYDADKYTECPHCAEMRLNGTQPLQPQKTDKKPSFFNRLSKKNKQKNETELIFSHQQAAQAQSSISQPMHRGISEMDTLDCTMVLNANEATDSLFEPDEIEQTMMLSPEEFTQDKDTAFEREQTMMLFREEEWMQEEEIDTEDDVQSREEPKQQAADAVDVSLEQTDMKTVCFFNLESQENPVVGWLVCLSGSHVGESFALKSGRNNIGRAESMDISLPNERSVSRDRHAVLTYEPIQRQFIIQAGESSGLTYLNRELVVTFKQLHDRDRLTLGQAVFLFVALCGEQFSWDEYL